MIAVLGGYRTFFCTCFLHPSHGLPYPQVLFGQVTRRSELLVVSFLDTTRPLLMEVRKGAECSLDTVSKDYDYTICL